MPFPWSISGVATIPLNDETPHAVADVVSALKDALTSVHAKIFSATDNTVTFSGAAAFFPFTFVGIDKGILTVSRNSSHLEINYALRTIQYAVITAVASAVFSWFASGAHNGDYSNHVLAFVGLFLLIWSVISGSNYIYNLINFPTWLRGALRDFEAR